ncbi:hypothetical protein V5P93_005048 [Actinokineospora auranticolor]|uniref:Cysteine dioxygenase type I n=1 Tax=Actinokineospora auranticolor TaxID=155976 RepID=A0A2S6GK95_9PSEU|nr:hypothetical protein [Actinokineospora auranticolor]PPK65576.1 hypothetical protein CLV40_11360 [Actinokineospora auranticolor]
MALYSELSGAIERGEAERVVGWARSALGGVIAGDLAVDAVRHPLGFLCLPVYRHGDAGVCVHLWQPGRGHERPTTSPTHCHSWELSSWVLVGGLRNQTLVLDDAGPVTHRVFRVLSGRDGDSIEATDRLVRAEVVTDTTHRAGERYSLAAGVFHETVVPDSASLVATVALGRTAPGAADLSLGGLRTTSHRVRRQLCGRAETVSAATAVVTSLAHRV